jgi:glutaredoxin 3
MSRSDRVAEITVYTLPWCPHCTRAKGLLSRRGLPFREVAGAGVPDFRRQIAALTGGYTVPQIVIDGEPIGGADRLARLDRLGLLEAIARGDPFPIDREIRRITPRSLAGWAAARLRGRHDVSAVNRVRVRIDRAGRVAGTDPANDAEGVKEERNGEGMCRTAG